MITGLNHVTFTVSNLETSINFYTNVLGFRLDAKWDNGAYLSISNIWLCLSKGSPKPSQDYSHIAFSITDDYFCKVQFQLEESNVLQWKENSSEGNSLYIQDPDGHKLEIHVGDLESRLKSIASSPYQGLEIFETT